MKAVAALFAVVLVPLGSSAPPGISPGSATALAQAISASPGLVTGAAFASKPPDGTPAAVAGEPLASFPTAGGTFAVLGTGDATEAASANANSPDDPSSFDDLSTSNGGDSVRGDTDFDVVVLRVALNVPAGANCLSFDFRFLSEEFREFVGKEFNDAFVAELDSSTWKTSGSTIGAVGNFAFDSSGKPVSVNTAGVSPVNSAGTTYDAATPLLTASTPVTPGRHQLYLSIFDQGDDQVDSAVFVDNLDAGAVAAGACKRGARAGGGGNPPPGRADLTPSGTVLIRLPGTTRLVPLTGTTRIPYGTEVNVTNGRITMRTSDGSQGTFYGGWFVLGGGTDRAPAGVGAAGKITELRLSGGNAKACSGAGGPYRAAAAADKSKKPIRTLWGKAKGRFRTKGRFASATVRGTLWLTQDRCDGTLVRVREGKVEVLDFRLKKKVLVKAGGTYLAKSP